MVTTSVDHPAARDAVRTPSVLVVLVAYDGAAWLRDTLRSLAKQTHPRLGIVAIDNGSSDGSRELLVHALGEERVVALDRNRGLAGALSLAAELPAAARADYLCLLHDDTALEPDAISRLVEAAEGIRGVEQVGVVGPKVVDWDDPRVLREVGRSTDAFGHPYTPLQDGELDQGQYDRVLEVLFVSSCAMLISAEAWRRTGAFDERFAGQHDDLDFCWRARLAGFRVLMTPLAQARHREATLRGERSGAPRSARYQAERAALASMLKDYGLLTLLWLLPLYVVFGTVRLVSFAVSRRFEDAIDLLAAWGWNLLHLPGTLRRRLRAQSVRRVPDRTVRRFMAGTLRLPRWFERAEALLEEELEEGAEELPRARVRARSLLVEHPVLVASALGVLVGALAVRSFVGPEALQGGAIAAWPARAGAFLQELLSPVRTTILGGSQAAGPSVAAFGGLSWLSFGSPALAQKVLLCALPPIAAVTMYRALARQTGEPGAAVAGASAYGLSAFLLWSFSQGRIPLLVGLAALPAIWDRLDQAFSPGPGVRGWRFAVGLGLALAVAAAADPGLLLAAGLVGLVAFPGRGAIRGLGWAMAGALCGGALVFPIVPDLLRAPGAALASYVGTPDVWSILRLAPGTAPGTRLSALFLPLAALVSFSVVGMGFRSRAWRAVLLVLASSALAWASAGRFLPPAFTNAPAYLLAAALGDAALIGFGVASLARGMARERFGYRQLAAGVLAVVLAIGLGGQVLQVALGGWSIVRGPAGLPPAWPLLESSAPGGGFEILWIGRVDGRPLPAPAGDPQGIVQAGPASVRYALTDRQGASALDTGRGTEGPGYAYLRSVLQELVSGSTSTAGALLGPLGVRFVVAGDGDLPPPVLERLNAQLDLDRQPAGGLVIYRNAGALPVASSVAGRGFARTAGSGDLARIAAQSPLRAEPLTATDDGWSGRTGGGYLYLARQLTSNVRASADGNPIEPQRAFGWASGFPDAVSGPVRIWFAGRWVRVVEMSILAALWVAALWITRKPGSA